MQIEFIYLSNIYSTTLLPSSIPLPWVFSSIISLCFGLRVRRMLCAGKILLSKTDMILAPWKTSHSGGTKDHKEKKWLRYFQWLSVTWDEWNRQVWELWIQKGNKNYHSSFRAFPDNHGKLIYITKSRTWCKLEIKMEGGNIAKDKMFDEPTSSSWSNLYFLTKMTSLSTVCLCTWKQIFRGLMRSFFLGILS